MVAVEELVSDQLFSVVFAGEGALGTGVAADSGGNTAVAAARVALVVDTLRLAARLERMLHSVCVLAAGELPALLVHNHGA